jgi:predicted lipid-binding transport protein (Tim44 family)
VLSAYAEEDMEALDALLGPQASQDFKDAITARRARCERHMLTFIGLKEMEVVDAWAKSNLAEITVRFTSEAVAATYAADGSLIDGCPDRVAEMIDTWTFARCITSRSPNWTLVAT